MTALDADSIPIYVDYVNTAKTVQLFSLSGEHFLRN